MSGVATDPPTGRDATTWTAAVAALVAKLKVAAAFGGETTFDAVGSRACADLIEKLAGVCDAEIARVEAASAEIDARIAAPEAGRRPSGIYIASKTTHGARWRTLRAAGYPVISTWIDEAEAGATSDWPDLWTRCVREASAAAALISL